MSNKGNLRKRYDVLRAENVIDIDEFGRASGSVFEKIPEKCRRLSQQKKLRT